MFDAIITNLGGRRITEGQILAKGNNFNAVRLALASGVIWTHCYWMVNGVRSRDDISSIIGLPVSHLCVNGFFFVSGFLVCQSLFRQPDALRFAAMRFGRVWPGLIACLLLTVACFALLSGRPLAYLSDDHTLRFLAMNLTQVKAYYELPSLHAVSEPMIVNGSLWTIPWELRCYVLLALSYGLAASIRGRAVAVATIASLAFCGSWTIARELSPVFPDIEKGLAYNVNQLARLWGCFSVGIAASLWWRKILIAPLTLVPFWLLAIAEHQLTSTTFIASPAIFYTVLVAAFAQQNGRATSADWHDFSYGIYIYAFPVMVVLHYFWPTESHPLLALANLAVTLVFAAFSWFLVEKPVLTAVKRHARAKSGRMVLNSSLNDDRRIG